MACWAVAWSPWVSAWPATQDESEGIPNPSRNPVPRFSPDAMPGARFSIMTCGARPSSSIFARAYCPTSSPARVLSVPK